jgi:hypothetical protein
LVNKNLDPWILYAGIPVRKLKERMKDETIALEKKIFEQLKNG